MRPSFTHSQNIVPTPSQVSAPNGAIHEHTRKTTGVPFWATTLSEILGPHTASSPPGRLRWHMKHCSAAELGCAHDSERKCACPCAPAIPSAVTPGPLLSPLAFPSLAWNGLPLHEAQDHWGLQTVAISEKLEHALCISDDLVVWLLFCSLSVALSLYGVLRRDRRPHRTPRKLSFNYGRGASSKRRFFRRGITPSEKICCGNTPNRRSPCSNTLAVPRPPFRPSWLLPVRSHLGPQLSA